jgi:serine/threonine protein kinase
LTCFFSSGPISSVYRVIERRTAKERIAKIVHNPKYFDWLRREMDILSHLHDSNIPHLHDAYETDKMLAIVLDKYVFPILYYFLSFQTFFFLVFMEMIFSNIF